MLPYHRLSSTMTFLGLLLLTSTSFAARLGEPADPVHAAEWIKGEPITLAEGKGKNIFVVEFWATWCVPCEQSIPHLTEMQKKYADKGVVFIGVSDETPEEIRPFVEKKGDLMDYRIIADKEQKTAEGYMIDNNENSIPFAYIVNREGVLVWKGSPMQGLEETLEQVINGTYDISAAIKEQNVQQATALIEVLGKLAMLGEKDLTGTVLRRITELAPDDHELQGQIAWSIVLQFKPSQVDMTPVLAMAELANKQYEGKNPIYAAALARAKFMTGNSAEAVELQKQAIANAGDLTSKYHEAFDEFLKEYQAGAN